MPQTFKGCVTRRTTLVDERSRVDSQIESLHADVADKLAAVAAERADGASGVQHLHRSHAELLNELQQLRGKMESQLAAVSDAVTAQRKFETSSALEREELQREVRELREKLSTRALFDDALRQRVDMLERQELHQEVRELRETLSKRARVDEALFQRVDTLERMAPAEGASSGSKP